MTAARGERVAAVASLGQRVGRGLQADPKIDELVHHRFVHPLVEVVHELGALVTEKPGVLEARGGL